MNEVCINDTPDDLKEAKYWLRELIRMKNEQFVSLDHKDCGEIAEVIDGLLHHRNARKAELETIRDLGERLNRTEERNKDWEGCYAKVLAMYEDERKFRDHIQDHLNQMCINGEVICKICGKTAKEITGRV